MDYEYNIRGWLKSINGGLPQGGDNDLFTQELFYEAPPDFNGDTLYNGMISAITWWQPNNDTLTGYGFKYDDIYQLIEADYHTYDGSWTDSDDFDVRNISYDKNGNLESLTRTGYNTIIDSLNYAYSGNQLKAAGDLATDVSGRGDFEDGTNGYAGTEYTYDDNGNMTKDDNKGINSITYTFLNLPETITFSGNNRIRYLYDATGTRWKTVIETSGTAMDSTIYMGGFVYNNDTLSFARTATGRMVPDGSDYRYDHFLTDHLGSTRVVFTDLDDDFEPDLIQESHYFPFGLEMPGKSYLGGQDNQILYTGKSIDENHSLNWYDYGARYYDPQLARWHSIDPLSELYAGFSPFHYVMNNPVYFYDPNGMSAFSDAVHNKLDAEGGHEYYNWYMASTISLDGRLRPDPNRFNNIGRFHHDPGVVGYSEDDEGNEVKIFQDPVTGEYYYWGSEEWESDESIRIIYETETSYIEFIRKDFGVIAKRVFVTDESKTDRDLYLTNDWQYLNPAIRFANNISLIATTTHNVLATTKIGSNIAYQLAYSKLFVQGSRLLKPLGHAGIIVSIPLEFIQAATGHQSWSMFGLNSTVSVSAAIIGGWYGIGIAGLYTLGQVGYDITIEGLEQEVIKPNPDLTLNYVSGLAPTPVIY